MREIHVELELCSVLGTNEHGRQPVWSLERGLREVPREKYGGPRVTCYVLNLFASETSSFQRSILASKQFWDYTFL